MIHTFIQVKEGVYLIPISEVSFWKQRGLPPEEQPGVVYHERLGKYYTKGEWKYIESSVPIHEITHQEYLAACDKREMIETEVRKTFVYDNEFLDTPNLDELCTIAYNRLNQIPNPEDIDELVDTKGWEWFSGIERKYKALVDSNEVFQNDYELETVGFKTEDLIQNLKRDKDYFIKWRDYLRSVYQREGLIMPEWWYS